MKTILKASLCLALFIFTAAAKASLLETSTYNNIAYFADDTSTALKRYSLASEQFLPPITLATNPKAIHVDSSGIYVSYGTSIVRLDLTGANAHEIRVTSKDIYDIESTDQYLLLSGYSYIQTLNKTTGTSIATAERWYSSPYISLSTDNSQIFSVSSGISPADIRHMPLAADGTLGNETDSPYHGAYQIGERPVVFPTKNRVVDTSGTVYNTMDLTFAGGLGGFYNDIGFWQGMPIVLRTNTLHSYNQALLETGIYVLPQNVLAEKLAIYLNKVFVFSFDGSGDHAYSFDVSLISPADPAAAVDPTNLAYTPDALALDKNQDTVYLLSKANLNIFRWSVGKSAYIPSIPLADSPLQLTYSADQQRIYLTYSNGAINYIDLTNNKEYPFANLGGAASAIVAAGKYVVARGPTGAWGSLSVFDKDGTRTDYRDWIEPTNGVAWDSTYERIYYISGFSPSDLHQIPLDTTTGKLGSSKDSPYHDSNGWIDPIRISENGKFIALNSGRVVDGKTMSERADTNSNGYFKDTVWLVGNVFTLKGVDSDTYSQVERWQADFSRDTSLNFEVQGTPVGLIPLASSSKLVIIYSRNNKPIFEMLTVNEMDFDKDGHLDSKDATPVDAKDWMDSDDDDVGDATDTDDDNDGVPDVSDAFPLNAKEIIDTDKDGIGNNSDTDDDNDGVPDTQDDLPLDPKESKDMDHDGIGDNTDPDKDGDGTENPKDAFPANAQEWLDTDKDGTGNNADTDDDNDGVSDSLDTYPLDATKSAIQAADFLPLTAGNAWLYDSSSQPTILASAVTIANQSITPLQFPAGSKLYLKTVNNQIQLFGFYLPSVNTAYGTFSTDITLNKGINLITSNSASGTGNVKINPTYGNRDLSWSASIQYMGAESVKVPAGEYSALHTRVSFSGSTTVDGANVAIYYDSDIWFAENVGIIKVLENGYPSNLVSATLAKPLPDASSGNGNSNSGGSTGGSGGGGSIGWLTMALLLLILVQTKVRARRS
jgi:hypothetical protein